MRPLERIAGRCFVMGASSFLVWSVLSAFGPYRNPFLDLVCRGFSLLTGFGIVGWAVVSVILLQDRMRESRDWDRTNQCRGCGYDLTGNVSGVCPECGTPV